MVGEGFEGQRESSWSWRDRQHSDRQRGRGGCCSPSSQEEGKEEMGAVQVGGLVGERIRLEEIICEEVNNK